MSYSLPDLLRHNAWANRTVLDAFRSAPRVLDVVCYDGQPLLRRLRHFVGTEQAFLGVMRGDAVRPSVPDTLEEIGALMASVESGLVEAAVEVGEAGQDRPFHVPWFAREFAFHELVAQVVGHSGQHRSELAWELARAGTSTGELDFIVWAASGRPAPGEPLAGATT